MALCQLATAHELGQWWGDPSSLLEPNSSPDLSTPAGLQAAITRNVMGNYISHFEADMPGFLNLPPH